MSQGRYVELQQASNLLSVFTSFARAASHVGDGWVILRLIDSWIVASLIDSLSASFNPVTGALPDSASLRGPCKLRNIDHKITRTVTSADLHIGLASSHSDHRVFEFGSRSERLAAQCGDHIA